MTEKEFNKRYEQIKMKYDIIVLSEIIKLHRDYGKEKYAILNLYSILHDCINYTEEEKNYIITKAVELSQEQN